MFGAKCDLLLYDLTSTYFEGQAGEIPAARRGCSRDSRSDALQLILAMVVTEEGLPLSYEVFEGNRSDVSTLEEILDSVERKHGKLDRAWVFDDSRSYDARRLNAPTIATSASVGPPNARRQQERISQLHPT